jgi:replicative DNA helicase
MTGGDISHLCDMGAEQALLGAFFIKPALITELSSIIEPAHFYEPLHQRIHSVMIRLAEEGNAITPVMLGPYFANEEPVGGLTVLQYFGRLAAAATTLHAAPYARMVREFSVRRDLHGAGLKAQQLAGDMERSPAQSAADAVLALDGIVSGAHLARQTRVVAAVAAQSLIDDLDRGQGRPPVPSGLVDLDNAIGGFNRGDYHILAGRPSMGKTALAGAFFLNAARHGIGTIFFSLEMQTPAVIARMFSDIVFNSDAPVPYRDILRHRSDPKRGALSEHQLWRLREAKQEFDRLPLVIDDQSNLSVAEIGARVRREAAKFEERGIELQFVGIDHKDFIRPSGRYAGNRVEENNEVSAGVKTMFKELEVAGLLISQLNREVEKRTNKRPEISDLRGAGAFEQDADMIMFPYREAYYLESSRFDDEDEERDRIEAVRKCQHNFEVIVGKQRNGGRIVVDLWGDMPNNAIRNKTKR